MFPFPLPPETDPAYLLALIQAQQLQAVHMNNGVSPVQVYNAQAAQAWHMQQYQQYTRQQQAMQLFHSFNQYPLGVVNSMPFMPMATAAGPSAVLRSVETALMSIQQPTAPTVTVPAGNNDNGTLQIPKPIVKTSAAPSEVPDCATIPVKQTDAVPDGNDNRFLPIPKPIIVKQSTRKTTVPSKFLDYATFPTLKQTAPVPEDGISLNFLTKASRRAADVPTVEALADAPYDPEEDLFNDYAANYDQNIEQEEETLTYVQVHKEQTEDDIEVIDSSDEDEAIKLKKSKPSSKLTLNKSASGQSKQTIGTSSSFNVDKTQPKRKLPTLKDVKNILYSSHKDELESVQEPQPKKRNNRNMISDSESSGGEDDPPKVGAQQVLIEEDKDEPKKINYRKLKKDDIIQMYETLLKQSKPDQNDQNDKNESA